MDLASMELADLIGVFLGFALTLCVFSYLIGDNLLFRLASHVFIGVAAGYVAVIAFYSIIWPRLLQPILFGPQPDRLLALAPLVLSVLLAFKAFPRLSGLGSPVMAYLVGVGAAATIGGAVLGTIFPQAAATAAVFDLGKISSSGEDVPLELLNGLIILVGTIATLGYFHFGSRARPGLITTRPVLLQLFYWLGGGFIAVTFGALFAGVYATALAAMVERVDFLVDLVLSLF